MMTVRQPTGAYRPVTAVFVATALIAFATGSTAIGAGCVVLAGSLEWARRNVLRHPLAEVETAVVRLRGGGLEFDFPPASIEGWQRDGRMLQIRLDTGAELRFGPHWSQAPAIDLERALAISFPALRR